MTTGTVPTMGKDAILRIVKMKNPRSEESSRGARMESRTSPSGAEIGGRIRSTRATRSTEILPFSSLTRVPRGTQGNKRTLRPRATELVKLCDCGG